ncbi:MAG: hypothetical protein NTW85_03820 [Methylococcales bacterium]|nr:hypothetical protein [Methylococcales bacterium]
MKQVMIVALGIVALASLTGVSYAEDTAPVVQAEKPQVVAPKKSKHIKKQPAAASQTDKQAVDKPKTDAPKIGSETDAAQGRGLPKAFSNSEGQ